MAETVQVTDDLDVMSWHFRWPRSGWATLTIIETTHQVAIQSDWGDVAYRWSSAGVGKQTMVEFFLDCSPSYLAGKLCSGLHTSALIAIDREATEKALNQLVSEGEQDGTLDKERGDDARECIDDLLDMLEHNDGVTPNEWDWHPEWYEAAVKEPGFIVQKLARDILPAMRKHLIEKWNSK